MLKLSKKIGMTILYSLILIVIVPIKALQNEEFNISPVEMYKQIWTGPYNG